MEISGDIAQEEQEELSNLDEDTIVIPEFRKIISSNPLTQDKGTPKSQQWNEYSLLKESDNGSSDPFQERSHFNQNYQETPPAINHSLMLDSTTNQSRIVVFLKGNNMIFKRKISKEPQNISMTPFLNFNPEQQFTFSRAYQQSDINEANKQNVLVTNDQPQMQQQKGSLKCFIQLVIMIANKICKVYHFSFQMGNLFKETFNWCNSSYLLKKICYHNHNINTQKVQTSHWSFPAYITRILNDFRFMSHFKDQVCLMQIILYPLQIRHLFSLLRIRPFYNPTTEDKSSAIENPDDESFYGNESNCTMRHKQHNISQFGIIHERQIKKKKTSKSLDGIHSMMQDSKIEDPFLACLKGALRDGSKTISGSQLSMKKDALEYQREELNFSEMASLASKQNQSATSSNEQEKNSEKKVTPYPRKFLKNEYNKGVYYEEIKNDLLIVTMVERSMPNPEFAKVSTKSKTIVFDLDETLIRCVKSIFDLKGNLYDFKTLIPYSEGKFHEVFVSLRPYFFEMLLQLSKDFELIIFTCGNEQYAEIITNYLQRSQTFFDFIIARKHCTPHPYSQSHIKDLRLLLSNRNIKDIIIVDNKPSNFVLHFTNGIPIKEYVGDKTDNELASLTQYLKTFLKEPDVRQKIKQDFKLQPFIKLRSTGSRDINTMRNSYYCNSKYQ